MCKERKGRGEVFFWQCLFRFRFRIYRKSLRWIFLSILSLFLLDFFSYIFRRKLQMICSLYFFPSFFLPFSLFLSFQVYWKEISSTFILNFSILIFIRCCDSFTSILYCFSPTIHLYFSFCILYFAWSLDEFKKIFLSSKKAIAEMQTYLVFF